MNKEQLEKILKDKYFYSGEGLKTILEGIMRMTGEIRDALETYLLTEKIINVTREGYSEEVLIREHNMSPIAAYLTLDYLEREPEVAIRSLQKGHDFVK